MPAGDPLSIEVTLAVLDRDGSTRGFVACEQVSWLFGKGIDTPTLSATVNTFEEDLAADPDLFDDALVQVLFDGAGVGQPFLITADDLTLIGGDEEAQANQVVVSARSALMLAGEWQVTPDEGVWLARSPSPVYFGWSHPDYDDSGWMVVPDRVTRAAVTGPKVDKPENWEDDLADWIWQDSTHGQTGGLLLYRLGSFTVSGGPMQIRIASTADEEHKLYLYGPGYGGVITDENKQETGYTTSRRFDRVLDDGTYFLAAEMTIVTSVGGDGFDALAFYVTAVDEDDLATSGYLLDSSDTAITTWRQSKTAERPGLSVGKILHLLRDWNQAWMTDTDASCHTTTFSFTEDEDSNGDPFPDLHEKSWTPGTPVASVLADLSDVVDFDCHLDPGDGHVVIDCYLRKGSDVSASVALVKGSAARDGNIATYRARRHPRTMTRASGLTEDGYLTKVDTTLETTVPPRATYIESQQSSSIGEGRRLAGRIIDEDGDRDTFEATFHAVVGSVPGVDFDWGDTIAALNRAGTAADKDVVTWGGQRIGDGEPLFTAEVA